MAQLKHIIRYFALAYPYKGELSKARMTKMVYLADWFSVKKYRVQISKVKWYFDHYGPFVPDVYEEALRDRKLKIVEEFTAFGTPKQTIYLSVADYNEKDLRIHNAFKQSEIEIFNEVIECTKSLNWSEFIDFVYSTPPIRNERRYSHLDLIKHAKETSDIN